MEKNLGVTNFMSAPFPFLDDCLKLRPFFGTQPHDISWSFHCPPNSCVTYDGLLRQYYPVIDNYYLLGVDTAATEIVLGLKGKYPIEINLTAAVPCTNLELAWNKSDQEKYYQLLSQCDSIKFVSNLTYQEAGGIKYLNARNRWVVNQIKNAHDMIIAIWDGQPGGTANCIADATKLNRRIIIYNWVDKNYKKLGNW